MHKTNYCPECFSKLPLEYIESKQETRCESCGRIFEYYYDTQKDCCVLEYDNCILDFYFHSSHAS